MFFLTSNGKSKNSTSNMKVLFLLYGNIGALARYF